MTVIEAIPICEQCKQPYQIGEFRCSYCGGPLGPPPKPSLLETLLEPRRIHRILVLGGILFLAGLVVWLTSLGVFDNAWVLACALGAGNLLGMTAGWAALKWSRYQLAGRALTLLACLVMPLNLWFYHAQGLMTLQGHLWLAGLVICVLYAASALVLRDPLFVHVLCAGLAMTGLLFLGDLGRLEEIATPATLLVILGLVALHAESVFGENDGPFSRARFGRAFFWSAQGLLASGLGLLLGAQMVGWIPGFRVLGIPVPAVVLPEYFVWTVLLSCAGVYAWTYSGLTGRWSSVFFSLAFLAANWALLQTLFYFRVQEVYLPLAFGMAGLVILALGRLVRKDSFEILGETARLTGHLELALALTAGGLLALSYLLLPIGELERLVPFESWREPLRQALRSEIGLAFLGLAALGVTPSTLWRRSLLALTAGTGLLVLFLLTRLTTLSPLEKVEVCCVVAGTALLLAGHLGWYREQERTSDLVSFNLFFGSLLVVGPLLTASVLHRFHHHISAWNEGGLILACVLLLGLGILCQLKWTTLVGSIFLVSYLVMILAWMHQFLHQQLLIGIYLTLAGGLLFAVGLFLSVYRERLLTLPHRIKNREGIFRVLTWR